MQTYAEKRIPAQAKTSKPGEGSFQFKDQRPEAAAHQRLQALADASPAVSQLRALQAKADAMPGAPIQREAAEDEEALQGKFAPVQRQAVEDEEPLQGKFAPIQRATDEEEPLQGKFQTTQRMTAEDEEPLQGKFAPVQRAEAEDEDVQLKAANAPQAPIQRTETAPRPNDTGLPDNLKSGIESLSGISMDSVKVHYNSDKPAQLNAYAYAQGTDIHLGPGQEKHLPHEAWHVVQQAQGRVKPTMQMKEGIPVNDDAGLEREADVMGNRSIQAKKDSASNVTSLTKEKAPMQFALPGSYEESNAPGYNPHGKADTYCKGVKNFDRLAADGFVKNWRDGMMNYWRNKGWVQNDRSGTFRWVFEQKNQKWVHEGGIQLDHAISVNTMKDDFLDIDNKQAINAAYANPSMKNYYHLENSDYEHIEWPTSKTLATKKANMKNITIEPTIHGARKYYHDIDNLVPLLGSDNASKGDDDSIIDDHDPDDLKNQREWVDMTSWAMYSAQQKDIDEVEDAVTAMRETLDEYDGDWPV